MSRISTWIAYSPSVIRYMVGKSPSVVETSTPMVTNGPASNLPVESVESRSPAKSFDGLAESLNNRQDDQMAQVTCFQKGATIRNKLNNFPVQCNILRVSCSKSPWNLPTKNFKQELYPKHLKPLPTHEISVTCSDLLWACATRLDKKKTERIKLLDFWLLLT